MTELEADLFQTHPESVQTLLSEVASGKLGLPQFQRDFIWAPANTASLLSSIMARYPAGSILAWRPGAQSLEARAIADAPALRPGNQPSRLILDGQQRITALYRALEGKTEEVYFIALEALVDVETFELRPHEEIVWEAVVQARELTAGERKARSRKKDPREPAHFTREWQYENFRFPLGENFDDWTDGLVDAEGEERKRRRDVLRAVRELYLTQLRAYRFPVTTLTEEASLSAVCNVFEKLNSNSIRLGPFEILTAKFYKDGVNLRALWEKSTADHSVLRDPSLENDHSGFSIDPYLLLQVITLIRYGSPQRRAVLDKLTPKDVDENWVNVSIALKRVIEWMRDSCGVIHRDLLPYQAILVPITGAWMYRDTLPGAKKADALKKISRYFWASVFTTNFDQGGASQSEKDYKDLIAWIRGERQQDGEVRPEALSQIRIKADDLLAATVKKKALLQGLMALSVLAGGKDFHKAERLTPSTYVESKVNSHHLFPRARLADKDTWSGIDPQGMSAELILNRALIDAETNRRIAAKKPSTYLLEMEDAGADLEELLGSHLASAEILRSDQYREFVLDRLASVVAQIEEAAGVAVEPLSEGDSPAEE